MLKTFTPEFMKLNKGCYSPSDLASCSFMKNGSNAISLDDIVNSEIKLKDKFWFVAKKCDLTIRQKQDLAIAVAEIVLVIYETKNPGKTAPREAIQAAKDYLAGTININQLRQKRTAAAYAAAAYADDAAADDAAAYADDAAAAYAAADAGRVKFEDVLLNWLKDFVKNN